MTSQFRKLCTAPWREHQFGKFRLPFSFFPSRAKQVAESAYRKTTTARKPNTTPSRNHKPLRRRARKRSEERLLAVGLAVLCERGPFGLERALRVIKIVARRYDPVRVTGSLAARSGSTRKGRRACNISLDPRAAKLPRLPGAV